MENKAIIKTSMMQWNGFCIITGETQNIRAMKKSILFGAVAFFALSAMGIQNANAQNAEVKSKKAETTAISEKSEKQVTKPIIQEPVKQKKDDCCNDKKVSADKKKTADCCETKQMDKNKKVAVDRKHEKKMRNGKALRPSHKKIHKRDMKKSEAKRVERMEKIREAQE